MKYPFEIKGNIVNNDDELHYLLECEIITMEEYDNITSQIDYKSMEEEKRKEEILQKFRNNKRTNWKQEYIKAMQKIDFLENQNWKLQKTIDDLRWKLAGN